MAHLSTLQAIVAPSTVRRGDVLNAVAAALVAQTAYLTYLAAIAVRA